MLTRDHILNLNEGPKIDALVSELVMGFQWDEKLCRICGRPLKNGCWDSNCSMRPMPTRHADTPAPYSTSMSAAFLVVEKLIDKYNFALWFCDNKYHCVFTIDKQCWWLEDHESGSAMRDVTIAKAAPLAICRAALQIKVQESKHKEVENGLDNADQRQQEMDRLYE